MIRPIPKNIFIYLTYPPEAALKVSNWINWTEGIILNDDNTNINFSLELDLIICLGIEQRISE